MVNILNDIDFVKNFATLSLAIYDYNVAPNSTVTWDYESQNQTAYWRLKVVDSIHHFVFRGSTTKDDFLRDVYTVANPFTHDKLGPVHPGAYIGLPEAWAEMKTKLGPNAQFAIGGHSLGSMETNISAGLAVLDGYTPLHQVCFGPPRPAFKQLGTLIKTIPQLGFRNISEDRQSWDHITTVPFDVWPEDFIHIGPLTDIDIAQPAPDPWGPLFDRHHMQLYYQACIDITEEEINAQKDVNMMLRQLYL